MYILFTGAPGSKWSSVCKNIYWSKDIDHSDYTKDRTYSVETGTPGEKKVMHFGAYWDPGMEFMPTDWDGREQFQSSAAPSCVGETCAGDVMMVDSYNHKCLQNNQQAQRTRKW